MDRTTFLVYSVLALALLVVGVPIAAHRGLVGRDLDQTARELDLALPADERPALLRRRRAVRVGDMVGGAVVFELGAWIASVVHDAGSAVGLLPQLTLLVGGGIGSAAGGLVAARIARPSGRRIARDRAVSLADYLPAAERWIARGALLLGGLTSATAVVITDGMPVTLWALAAGVLATVGFELGARRIVAAAQPVDTVDGLAWSDATRALLLRKLAFAAAGVGILSTMLAGPAAVDSMTTAPGPAKLFVLPLVLFAFVIPIWNLVGKPGRFAVQRLWPNRATRAAEGTLS